MAANGDTQQGLKRPRYFDRQQLKAEDLTLGQTYVKERLRRLNRHLHGCGVVCGLEVRPKLAADSDAEVRQVVVTPGLALSPQGEEIYVTGEQTVSVCLPGFDPFDPPDCLNPDPVDELNTQTAYLVIRYAEYHVHPVPTIPEDCGPPQKWEASATCESFEIDCLAQLPGSWTNSDIPCGQLPSVIYGPTEGDLSAGLCPPDTCDPWVVLAGLRLDPGGELVVDYSIRSSVIGGRFLDEVLRCGPAGISQITPTEGRQGETVDAVISGWGLKGIRYVHIPGSDVVAELIAEENVVTSYAPHSVRNVVYSSDAKYVASLGTGYWKAWVWSVETGQELAEGTLDFTPLDIAFSPVGDLIVVAQYNGVVRKWAFLSGQENCQFFYHGGYLSSIVCSPTGPYLVTVGSDYIAKVWELYSGQEITRTVSDHLIRMVLFSPDGRYLWAWCYDNSIRQWEAFSGSERQRFTLSNNILALALSVDGRYLAASEDAGPVRVFDTASRSPAAAIEFADRVIDLTFSPDGERLAISGSSGDIRLYETVSWRQLKSIPSSGHSVAELVFSPDGEQFLTRYYGQSEAGVWDAESGKKISSLRHPDVVDSIAFNPDSHELMTSCQDGKVRTWRLLRGTRTGNRVPVKITINPYAKTGLHFFRLVKHDGTLNSMDSGVSFCVRPAAQPVITGITPDNGRSATTVDVSIWGRNLADVQNVAFWGTGISTEVLERGELRVRVRLTIPSNVVTGYQPFEVITTRGVVKSQDFGVYFYVWSIYGYGYGYIYGYGGGWEMGIGGNLL